MERINRRAFIKSAAKASGLALAGPYFLTSSALGNSTTAPASERVNYAVIGCGIRGTRTLPFFLKLPHCQVVAVCDPFVSRRNEMKKSVEDYYASQADRKDYKGCQTYNDYRQILQRKDIDAIGIFTPDHWHAIMTIEAAKAGKDVYVEKPMDISVAQGQAMRAAIQKYGRIFQHGTQQRSAENFRYACELARNQKIGKLRRIIVATPPSIPGPVVKPMPIPKDLDYPMWIGPAPMKPYTEIRCKKGGWYHICDYTIGGFIGGWGVHHIDIAQWGNDADETGPVEIAGSGVLPEKGIYDAPISFIFKLRYANGVEVIFIDNKQQPHGVRFEGDQGWIFVKRRHIDAHPKSLLEGKINPEFFYTEPHFKNFIDCVKTRKRPAAPVEIAHRSTTICSLAHIALQTGKILKWDPVKERFTNSDEANTMLTRPIRAPWHL